MGMSNDLGEGNGRGDQAGEPSLALPPPEYLWVRATCNLNVGGDRLVRGSYYQVDPLDSRVAPLLEGDPPWLLPLPGQGWGDRLSNPD